MRNERYMVTVFCHFGGVFKEDAAVRSPELCYVIHWRRMVLR